MQYHKELFGKTERVSFSKFPQVLDLPNLLKVQKDSYRWFIEEGLGEILEDISPIEDYNGNLILEFVGYDFDDETKYTIEEAKYKDTTYSRDLKVKARLINKETEEVKEQEVFMGDFPMMTDSATFVINGAERVIVSQLVRSPGVYYASELDKSGNKMYSSTVIPNRGAWIEFDTDASHTVNVRLDRTRKLPATTLVRALLFENDEEIIEALGDTEHLRNTLEKENSETSEEALIEIYKKLKPGDPASLESAQNLINNLLFDDRRYDLAKVGRYKYNKKLALHDRLIDQISAKDVIDDETGELFVKAGEMIDRQTALNIENSGINVVDVIVKQENGEDKELRICGNHFVYLDSFEELEEIDLSNIELSEKVYYPVMREILDDNEDKESIINEIERRKKELCPKNIVKSDILAAVNYQFNLFEGIGDVDDIDHLGNRRVRGVGELLQNQFRIGLARMERVVRERMTTQDPDLATPQGLINIKPVTAVIKEFFGSSQLSQFMDQTNPMSELTHKRRLSALGPGGLSRDRAGVEVRDVHDSHYGRICPIETPEGPNIGLITSLTTYARINKYGFIETPYRKVGKDGYVTDEIDYLTADIEDDFIIAQANEPLDENNRFINDRVSGRGINGENDIYPRESVEYMDVSPQQIVSVGASLIPFLENDDSTRALMGANMQRQAVPLLKSQAPIVATGIEHRAAKDSGVCVVSKNAGEVVYVGDEKIRIKRDSDGEIDYYRLLKFRRANQGTTINQRPIVKLGDHVDANEIIADGPSTEQGELALGKNILIAFTTWEGYNYEDAMLLNEQLVMDDVLTSVHIEEHECEARETKLGAEEITKDIPNVGDDMKKNLDENGVIRIGAEVKSGDILVGKVSPKGETELSPEERLLRAIFGEKAREVRDTSLTVPHGESGIVVDVKEYNKKDGDELSPGVNKVIRVFVATKRKIMVGDKMCGRHGNKGVVSRIMPREDMPFLPDGTPIQICLNPLGIPSRMNIGQVLEVHMGLAARTMGWKIATPVFDGALDTEIEEALEEAKKTAPYVNKTGKIRLRDGRTGEEFQNPVTVGVMYMLKLHHMVEEKIHARSIGPYSLVTQQPLGGKAQFGGQRFGEMEVWALEAYGASHTLQEMLTVKSDDVTGRVKTYESIVKGENVPEPGTPESFKVLVKELQSLALDVELLDEDGNVIELKENIDEQDKFSDVEKIDASKIRSQSKKLSGANLSKLEDKKVESTDSTNEGVEELED
ncbi:DNA-directed RNA polymerase subunit beta [Anaerococcus hydrogenalis]|uniref:DNA-directed RNA polymerase subunit beta n=2 Tax=Anaerococcus hydrogenalis TaxID=33029 RepID=A0A2N6UHA9_9FIRM|nr:DNA-directed RNA polymerase subunit beta [Anaerococcus hydrogenalis]MDK7695581.1 DNA-directed RNA polymerase subunit beta [Anaerococcus hydrogenalis]MDK7697340.1 DNA-directed RNA polymerase subunit beta [Anaerococcus hydrogenalis]MDK7708680.1 DNA-directed RNA polymerase subunit beta [Anaerococcus hydrogenalis]PMC80884.1 DNA-directed RNA polymerase subunit beta [Anaerococcus hydrogenalis]